MQMYNTKNDVAKDWSTLHSSPCLVTEARTLRNKSHSLTRANVLVKYFLYANVQQPYTYLIKLSWSCSSWRLNLLSNPLLSLADLVSPLGGITSISILPQAHRHRLPPLFPFQGQNLRQNLQVLPAHQGPAASLQLCSQSEWHSRAAALRRNTLRACKLLHALASKKLFCSRCC